jgi:hypothetical protein
MGPCDEDYSSDMGDSLASLEGFRPMNNAGTWTTVWETRPILDHKKTVPHFISMVTRG